MEINTLVVFILGIVLGIIIDQYALSRGIKMVYDIKNNVPAEQSGVQGTEENIMESKGD